MKDEDLTPGRVVQVIESGLVGTVHSVQRQEHATFVRVDLREDRRRRSRPFEWYTGDQLEDVGPVKRAMRGKRTPRQPMDAYQRELVQRLYRCSMSPGSWDKRFVRDLHAELAPAAKGQITTGQVRGLMLLRYRYRRQLGITDPIDELILDMLTDEFGRKKA